MLAFQKSFPVVLLILPTNWNLCKGHQFDFPGHDLLFLQRVGLEQLYGAETQWSCPDFRGNGQLELLEAQIFLVSGAFEEHKARNFDPGSGSFVTVGRV